jgi:hypothetical protein
MTYDCAITHSRLHSPAKLLILCSLAAISTTSPAQRHVGISTHALVKWDRDCSQRGCLIQTDVLRGISDDPHPPDPSDSREYVNIDVAMERATRRPAFITFMVDPRAKLSQGIFVAFTHPMPTIDHDGATRLEIEKCTEDACTVHVPNGLAVDKSGRTINLMDTFLQSDSLLVLYVRDGKPYRAMVLLSSFQKEYRRVLTSEFK